MKGELTFMDKLQEILGKVSIKLSGNLYINAIKDGMLAYMPFAFIASIFLIIYRFCFFNNGIRGCSMAR